MISIKSVSHTYAKSDKQISFRDWEINDGEQWLLLGDSGSGKSTLLHILTGILQPDHGEVIINNTSIYNLSQRELDQFRGRHIGIIFQRPHLIKSITIADNLLLAQNFARLPKDFERISYVLESLGIAEKMNAFPDALSQGQLQRASIARAVINKPTLIIADEPTSSLDDKNAFAALDILMTQSAANDATLIVATHDKRVIERFSDTYILV